MSCPNGHQSHVNCECDRAEMPEKEQMALAYIEFARREMPWVLDVPSDDAESLCRTTASIAFQRGYEAATKRAQRVPMTDEQAESIVGRLNAGIAGTQRGWGWIDVVREVERHHGIGVNHD